MKPIISTKPGRGFPRIDLHFQSDRLTGGAPALSHDRRAFRNLRHEVFLGVNRRGSVREAIIFGALVALSAWPIVTMVAAIIKLAR